MNSHHLQSHSALPVSAAANPDNPDPIYDTPGAAVQLKLSPSTLNKKRCDGSGPPYYLIGRRVVYRRSDLIAWLEKHRRYSTSVAA